MVTDVGSLSEAVDDGKTGYIVPPRDAIRLGQAIIALLRDDQKRKRMGENAYAKSIGELSWDRIAERTVEVYEEALRGR